MLLSDFLNYARIHPDETQEIDINIEARGRGRLSNMKISRIMIEHNTITVECFTNESDKDSDNFAINYINASDEERKAADAVFKNPVMF